MLVELVNDAIGTDFESTAAVAALASASAVEVVLADSAVVDDVAVLIDLSPTFSLKINQNLNFKNLSKLLVSAATAFVAASPANGTNFNFKCTSP